MMMKHCVVAVFYLLGATGEALAGDDVFEEMFAPYRQRIDGVTASAGNAKAINSATHIIDPWPPYVANRRIPANGERMVGAMERYRDVKKIGETPSTLEPDSISTSEVTNSGASQ
jgi:hypothetical protein